MNQRTQAILRKWAYSGGDFARDVGWGGGGALTGMLVNNLLGNNSLQSYLLSGGIGAVGGLGLKSAIKSIAKANDIKFGKGTVGAALFGGDPAENDLIGTELGLGLGISANVGLDIKKRRQIDAALKERNERRLAAAEKNLEQAERQFGVDSKQYETALAAHNAAMENYNNTLVPQYRKDRLQYLKDLRDYRAIESHNAELRRNYQAALDQYNAQGATKKGRRGRGKPPKPPKYTPLPAGGQPQPPKEPTMPERFKLSKPQPPTHLRNADGSVKYIPATYKRVGGRWSVKNFGRKAGKTALITLAPTLLGYLFDMGRARFID